MMEFQIKAKRWLLTEFRRTNWLLIVMLITLIALFGITLYSVKLKYENRHLKGELALLQSEQELEQVPTSSTPTRPPLPDLSNKVFCSREKTGWKVFTGSYYSIAFPENWTFKGAIPTDTGFAEAISLTSPSNDTELLIGLKYDFPFGIEEDPIKRKKRDIKVKIGNEIYNAEESIYTGDERAPYSSVYVLLEAKDMVAPYTDRVSGEEKELPFVFMFGNDYPLYDVRVFKQNYPEKALEEYRKDEQIIFQILSTFKFIK